MLKKIGIGLLIVIALIVIISFLLPSNSIVERSIVVNAPVEVVYNQVNDFRNWKNWSPWAEKDPDMKIEYSGTEKGAGSKYCWNGDPDAVGIGCLSIVENVENESINTLLQFEGMGEGRGSWTFEKISDGVKVTWSMNSDMSTPIIVGKYFGLMMDGMIGPDFEFGLNKLKSVSESMPAYSIEIIEDKIQAMNYVFVNTKCSAEEIGTKMNESAGKMMAFIEKNNLEIAGTPFTTYYEWEESFDFDFAFPVNQKMEEGENDVQVGSKEGFKCIKGIFYGDYAESGSAHNEVSKYLENNGLKLKGQPMEFYPNDPMTEPDTSKWITEVVYQI